MSGTPERVWIFDGPTGKVAFDEIPESFNEEWRSMCIPYVPEAPKVEGLPTEPGWYWCRSAYLKEWGVVEVTKDLKMYGSGQESPMKKEDFDLIYGPLQPPESEEQNDSSM